MLSIVFFSVLNSNTTEKMFLDHLYFRRGFDLSIVDLKVNLVARVLTTAWADTRYPSADRRRYTTFQASAHHFSSQLAQRRQPSSIHLPHSTANSHHGRTIGEEKTFCGLRSRRLENGQLGHGLEKSPKVDIINSNRKIIEPNSLPLSDLQCHILIHHHLD
jgi:hypothetical protein